MARAAAPDGARTMSYRLGLAAVVSGQSVLRRAQAVLEFRSAKSGPGSSRGLLSIGRHATKHQGAENETLSE
jgi:hypothetical protein